MPIEPDFLELMPDTIQYEAYTGADAYGRRSWAAAVAVPNCRVQYKVEAVMGPEGQEVLRAATIYTATILDKINLLDRITLPSGQRPRILGAGVESDEMGPHHTVIEVGVSSGAT